MYFSYSLGKKSDALIFYKVPMQNQEAIPYVHILICYKLTWVRSNHEAIRQLHSTCTITTQVQSYTPGVKVSLKQLERWRARLEFSPERDWWGQLAKWIHPRQWQNLSVPSNPEDAHVVVQKSVYKIRSPDDLHLKLPSFQNSWF